MDEYIKNSILSTKNSFENSFKEANFYNKQTTDDKHLEMILNSLQIKPGDKILDLGTGSGYLAFELAKKFLASKIIGLDIVENTFKEISRVLEKDSYLFISDPTPNKNDDVINSYNVKISDNNKYIFITQKVLNLTFKKGL